MKTNEEINRYFTEEVFGKCWHEWEYKYYMNEHHEASGHSDYRYCILCKSAREDIDYNPDYFSKEGFWDVWEHAIKRKWFHDFVHENVMLSTLTVSSVNDLIGSIDYKTFAHKIFNFLEGEK